MKEISKQGRIGIYIDSLKNDNWHRLKSIIPALDCHTTVFGISGELDPYPIACEFVELDGCLRKKQMLDKIYCFVMERRPKLFFVDGCPEVAAFLKLLNVPYVYTRSKTDKELSVEEALAYKESVFNIAFYNPELEMEDFKRSDFYQKTKYPLICDSGASNKLLCMYLQGDISPLQSAV